MMLNRRKRHSGSGIWRLQQYGVTVYRRAAHLVVWDDRNRVTVAPFYGLYWNPREGRTFVCVNRLGDEGAWLPLTGLIGHWDWFTGRIVGLKVFDGYGPDGVMGPKYEQVFQSSAMDEDTGHYYWRSDRARLVYRAPEPMAHT